MLSEPQIFSCDVQVVASYLQSEYCYQLSASDNFDPDLPLIQNKAFGGTMILWKCEFTPFIQSHPSPSSAFSVIILAPPGLFPTVHVAVYLPTQGLDRQFLDELTSLSNLIQEIRIKYTNTPIFLRGDFNVSFKNKNRRALLKSFLYQEKFREVTISHKTYHHFMGNGASDSNLDKILVSTTAPASEEVKDIICCQDNPFVTSHHDVILSNLTIPGKNAEEDSDSPVSTAPKLTNKRHKILWSETGVQQYQELIVPHLSRLQALWLSSPPSMSSMSLLLSSTADVLSECAQLTNKSSSCLPISRKKSCSTPKFIRQSSVKLLNKWNRLKRLRQEYNASSYIVLKQENIYNEAKKCHRKLIRNFIAKQSIERDTNLLNSSSDTFARIRRARSNQASTINKIQAGDKTYLGDNVPFGFYEAIKQLKTCDSEKLRTSRSYNEFALDYSNIIKLCKDGRPIQEISEADALNLLKRMKANVIDCYSITPNHYLLAGPAGWKHFSLLLNALLRDLRNTTIDEVNTTYACILFKGHNKDKTLARSYRTISTCPVIGKALDLHIRDLNIRSWNLHQASTQFQGQDSSHELAAILLTECIQHSVHSLKQPLYVLYLDAKSAFDLVQRISLIRNLFFAQNQDQTIILADNRLMNRKTIVDWNGQLMGPVVDQQGLEQGGINSSDFYKIFGRDQLTLAEKSQLGVRLGNLVISDIGQADDTVLLSNDIYSLAYLLELTMVFCAKFLVE